jgi:hypothetical protein
MCIPPGKILGTPLRKSGGEGREREGGGGESEKEKKILLSENEYLEGDGV